ncbi:hypothetical protein MY10362_007831 [Beauveria mimosiformis]
MKLSAALAAAVLATTTTALPAVAEAVAEAAAAVLAATTTALPAVAEAAAAPARKNWGMPLINHGAGASPDARRSTPELDKVTTSDNSEDDDDDDDLDDFGSPVKRRGDDDDEEEEDGDGDDDDDDDLDDDGSGSGAAEHHRRDDDDHDYDLDGFYSVERRALRTGGDLTRPKPISLTLTHPKTIEDGRGVDKSDFENFGEELMRRAGRHRPIVDHTPVERRRADAGKPVADAFWGMPVVEHVPVPDTKREVAAAELESRREPFPIVDHQPSEP